MAAPCGLKESPPHWPPTWQLWWDVLLLPALPLGLVLAQKKARWPTLSPPPALQNSISPVMFTRACLPIFTFSSGGLARAGVLPSRLVLRMLRGAGMGTWGEGHCHVGSLPLPRLSLPGCLPGAAPTAQKSPVACRSRPCHAGPPAAPTGSRGQGQSEPSPEHGRRSHQQIQDSVRFGGSREHPTSLCLTCSPVKWLV